MAWKWLKSKRRRSGADHGARLLDVLAQVFTQSGVQQVGGGVVGRGGRPGSGVHAQLKLVALGDAALGHLDLVHDKLAAGLLSVHYLGLAAGPAYGPHVARLAAGRAVEGGALHHQLGLLALAHLVYRLAVHQDQGGRVAAGEALVAGEGGAEALGA